MRIDLHSHTAFSDGLLQPEELILRAHNMQLDVLAITDHDTVAAIPKALEFQATQKRALHIVPGVELSTSWHGFDIHVLGLNVNIEDEQFQQRLEFQAQSRNERAELIDAKLQKCGFKDVLIKARMMAGVGQITRAHFARAMVDMAYVSNFDSAFKKYLGKGKRAHVSPKWIEIEEAVNWIQDAGGTAILAHPGHYKLKGKWLRKLLVHFKSCGGDGIEVSHPHLAPSLKQQLKLYALEYEFLGSAGSDFHAPGRWTDLGRHLDFSEEITPVWQGWQLPSAENCAIAK